MKCTLADGTEQWVAFVVFMAVVAFKAFDTFMAFIADAMAMVDRRLRESGAFRLHRRVQRLRKLE